MIQSMKCLLGIYADTLRKIGFWSGWILSNLDRLNEKVFDLLTSHEPYKDWMLDLAFFVRKRGTDKAWLFQEAAGQALARMDRMGENRDDNALLYRCLYGLTLYKLILGSYLGAITGASHQEDVEKREAFGAILTDEEVRQLLDAIDEKNGSLQSNKPGEGGTKGVIG
jgi:hypothetical protein